MPRRTRSRHDDNNARDNNNDMKGRHRARIGCRGVEIDEHLDALEREGSLLGDVAAASDLDATVPTCPEWTVRDLVRHIGDVHRWAGAHVAERRTERVRGLEALFGPLPADDELIDWYRAGHARLLEILRTADPDVECYSFLPAPSPLRFWARRQAHETAIHRADAESASGAITPYAPAFAADGVDELLLGFFGRRPADRSGPDDGSVEDTAGSLHLRADDVGRDWLIRASATGLTTSDGAGDGDPDCSVRGTASDLYLLLWNRRTVDGLDVLGDPTVLREWRENAVITWGGGR